jgi:hypothetical protein
MGLLQQTKASLRIFGDDLNPDELTRLLCCNPTDCQSKGDEIVGKSGRTRIAASGRWSLKAPVQQPGNLNAQIAWLMSAVNSDIEVWKSIAARYKVDLFCGLFMDHWNDGESISCESLSALGARHIQLDLDIYGATAGEMED